MDLEHVDNKVVCQVCGKSLKQIDRKHLKLHNLTTVEYKVMFLGCELVSAGTIERKKWSEKRKIEASLNHWSRDPIRKVEIGGKISRAEKGRTFSKDHCEKISKALMGRKLTPEHRKAVGDGNRGKEVPEEARKNIKASHWSRRPEKRKEVAGKLSVALTGKKASEEQKKNISEALTGRKLAREHRDKIKIGVRKAAGRISDSVNEFYCSLKGVALRQEQSIRASKQRLDPDNGFGSYHRSIHGEIFSFKNLKFVSYQSSYEWEAFKNLELDLSVLWFTSQPFSIPYEFEGIQRRYIPDILVVYKNGRRILVEVKPSWLITDPAVQAKAKAAIKYCEENGIDTFEFWTEKELFKKDDQEAA